MANKYRTNILLSGHPIPSVGSKFHEATRQLPISREQHPTRRFDALRWKRGRCTAISSKLIQWPNHHWSSGQSMVHWKCHRGTIRVWRWRQLQPTSNHVEPGEIQLVRNGHSSARFFVDLLIFCLPNLLPNRINMKLFRKRLMTSAENRQKTEPEPFPQM